LKGCITWLKRTLYQEKGLSFYDKNGTEVKDKAEEEPQVPYIESSNESSIAESTIMDVYVKGQRN